MSDAIQDAADRAERQMSISRVAALIGRDRGTLTAWIKNGCPVARAGGTGDATLVDLKAVIVWREEQVRAEEREKYGGSDPELGGARLTPSDMLKLEQLKLTRLKVGEKAEILIPRWLAEAAFERALGLVRQAVMAVPERLVREMAGFPEDRKLAWRQKAMGQCRSALREAAKAIETVMPGFKLDVPSE